MNNLSSELRAMADLLGNLATHIERNVDPSLVEMRYQLLYTIAANNIEKWKSFCESSTVLLLNKIDKLEKEAETSNIIIKAQGHTIQEKEQTIKDMQKRIDELKEWGKRNQTNATLYKDQRDLKFYECSTLTEENKKLRELCIERFERIHELEEELKKEKNLSTMYFSLHQESLRQNAANHDTYLKHLEALAAVYEDIRLLPEDKPNPFPDADVVDRRYFEIKGKRYTLWGKGAILEMGRTITCKEQ